MSETKIMNPFMILAVFDVLLAVNMCINYSFLHLLLVMKANYRYVPDSNV